MQAYHDSSDLFCTRRPDGLELKLEAEGVEQAFVRTAPDGEEVMLPMGSDLTAVLPLSAPRLGYRFYLKTAEGAFWLSAAGLTRHTPTDATDFRYLSRFESPAWLEDAVFYQVFPDRFYDGESASNVQDGEYLCSGKPVIARAWHELPQAKTGWHEFFGGDLPGLEQKLDYLQELGCNAIYLNPIFTAPSSHKYDVADYREVDPHLGGDRAFASLMQAVHRQGMRLILDVVPNHCGETHPWFVQALQDKNAPTAEFFSFLRHPHEYECWLGVKSLPKLNYRSALLREEMISILRHWLRPPYRLDGWRLDVANMLARQGESQLGHKIGRALRRAVKAENPEAYLLGEHFFDGTPHLQGEELDASMNYRGFTMPVLHWLSGGDLAFHQKAPHGEGRALPTAALVAQWMAFLSAIPWQVACLQFNQLGSHDMPRIRFLLGEDLDRVQAAMVLLFAFPGVPCVYYGDEVGMSGGRDPHNRAPMVWQTERWCQATRELVKRLCGLRRSSSALRRGGFRVLHEGADRVVLERRSRDERLVVDVRRGSAEAVELPGLSLVGLLGGERLSGRLPAVSRAGGEIYCA
ncbi:maltodextrin glucosidase [bacterium CPR1]|nr:maltodextrin glucosidase [bacterium CPR1]